MIVNPGVSPEYTEKVWGKDVGGEYITDGYAFRGKRSFGKVVIGLKEHMKKGVENETGNVKYKALDVRKNGAGLEIDVEIVNNGKMTKNTM